VGPMSKSSRTRSIVRDTLVTLVRDPEAAADQLRSLDASHLEMVLKHAEAQKLGTAIAACLRSASLPVPDWLEAHRFKVASRKATIMGVLAQIAPAMNTSGIPWVVLKGPVTAASFASPHLREFGDLDILVPGRRLAETLEVLSRVGIDAMNQNWDPYVRYGVAEFPVFIGGAPVDLHWHLIGLGRMRKRFSIDINNLLSRRQPVSLGGVDCYRLDFEDHLMHVALHAGLSGAGNLGTLRDIHEIIGSGNIDWDEFVIRSKGGRAGPIVGQVLDRCASVLGTPVPEAVPVLLAPRSALVIRSRIDSRPRSWGNQAENAYSGFVVGAARSGARDTAAVARGMITGKVAMLFAPAPLWSAFDPSGPLFWQRSTSEGIDRYLSMADRDS
jgi:hypothetical protein